MKSNKYIPYSCSFTIKMMLTLKFTSHTKKQVIIYSLKELPFSKYGSRQILSKYTI